MEEKGSLRIQSILWAAAIFLAVMLLSLVSKPASGQQEMTAAYLVTAGAFAVGFGVLGVLRHRFARATWLVAGLGICVWLLLAMPRIAILPPLLFFLALITLAGHRMRSYLGALAVFIVMSAVRLAQGASFQDLFDFEILAYASLAALVILYAQLRTTREVTLEHQRRVREFAERTSEAEKEQGRILHRSKVSYQLHDELAHNLAVASLHTNAALDASSTDTRTALSLIHVRQAVTGAMTALRRTFDTMGQLEAPEELTATIEDIERIATSLRDTGIEVNIHSSGLGQTENFPQLAMRIIREAATNAVKHADPTQMVIWIKEETDESQPPYWVVSVRNNGVRPVHSQTPNGQGLARLRAMTEAEGGTMEWGRLATNFLLSATVRKDVEENPRRDS